MILTRFLGNKCVLQSRSSVSVFQRTFSATVDKIETRSPEGGHITFEIRDGLLIRTGPESSGVVQEMNFKPPREYRRYILSRVDDKWYACLANFATRETLKQMSQHIKEAETLWHSTKFSLATYYVWVLFFRVARPETEVSNCKCERKSSILVWFCTDTFKFCKRL